MGNNCFKLSSPSVGKKEMDNYSKKFFDRFIQNKFNLQNAFFEEIIISRRSDVEGGI